MVAVKEKTITDDVSRELIHRAREGDAWAKEEFFRHEYRNLPKIVSPYVNKYRGSIPGDKLHEMAHTAMMYAYTGYLKDDGGKPFIAFWRMAMGGRMHNYWKRDVYSSKGESERMTVSLDAPLMDDSDATFGDLLDDQGKDDDNYARVIQRDALRIIMAEFMENATPKELDALKHFGRHEAQRITAGEMGISQMTVSRKTKKVLKRLQDIARKHELFEEGEGVHMARGTVHLGHLKYLFINSALTNGQIQEVTGTSAITVGKYRRKHEMGKMSGVKPDDSVQHALDNFMWGLPADKRRALQDKQRQKASPVEVSSLRKPEEEEAPIKTYFIAPARISEEEEITSQAFDEASSASEDKQPAAPEPRGGGKAVRLTLDKADPDTIDQFLVVVRRQLKEGKAYRFHVEVEELNPQP